MQDLKPTYREGVTLSGWQPSGTHGYDDLRRDAIELEILGVQVPLAEIICSKEAADRPKDRLTLPVLRRILEEGPRPV